MRHSRSYRMRCRVWQPRFPTQTALCMPNSGGQWFVFESSDEDAGTIAVPYDRVVVRRDADAEYRFSGCMDPYYGRLLNYSLRDTTNTFWSDK